jgi:hypothetical protein
MLRYVIASVRCISAAINVIYKLIYCLSQDRLMCTLFNPNQDTRATVLCNAAEADMLTSNSDSNSDSSSSDDIIDDIAPAVSPDIVRANERLADALQLRESLDTIEHPKLGWTLSLLGEIHRIEGKPVTSEGLFRYIFVFYAHTYIALCASVLLWHTVFGVYHLHVVVSM